MAPNLDPRKVGSGPFRERGKVPKRKPKRTSPQRVKAFSSKVEAFEREFGTTTTLMTMFDGMAEVLIEAGLVPELELIQGVEKAFEKNGEVNRRRQAIARRKLGSRR